METEKGIIEKAAFDSKRSFRKDNELKKLSGTTSACFYHEVVDSEIQHDFNRPHENRDDFKERVLSARAKEKLS